VIQDQAAATIFGPAPCDSCRHAVRCGKSGEACLSFQLYAAGKSEGVWRLQPKQPRADIGKRLGFRMEAVLHG
jgi:hypothetical protein